MLFKNHRQKITSRPVLRLESLSILTGRLTDTFKRSTHPTSELQLGDRIFDLNVDPGSAAVTYFLPIGNSIGEVGELTFSQLRAIVCQAATTLAEKLNPWLGGRSQGRTFVATYLTTSLNRVILQVSAAGFVYA